MMIVNYANAMKLSGDLANAITVLDQEDWSLSGLHYQICVSAIKGQNKEVIAQLKPAFESGLLSSSKVREWQVFAPLREKRRIYRGV